MVDKFFTEGLEYLQIRDADFSLSLESTKPEAEELEDVKENKKVSSNYVYVKSPAAGLCVSEEGWPKKGDKVEKEQVLFKVEVMKTLIDVKCSVPGMISKVFVQQNDEVVINEKLVQIEKLGE